jgi:hypothetical protein
VSDAQLQFWGFLQMLLLLLLNPNLVLFVCCAAVATHQHSESAHQSKQLPWS